MDKYNFFKKDALRPSVEHRLESVSGWRVRAIALRDVLREDTARWKRFHRHGKGEASTVAELLEWLKSSSE